MTDWAHAWTPFLAAFLASLVEFVEALTIVLAVGTVRGWRPAMAGTIAGALFLTLLVLCFGPTLRHVPIIYLQMVVGALLLLFGMRWLRKAVLRSAGVIGLHDEEAIYNRQTRKLAAEGPIKRDGLDPIAVATTFKAVVLEGLEVVFIVIATGAIGNRLIPAVIGATAAGILVVLLGLLLHRPLTRVPENTLKFAVGVLLSAFGAFWLGEGAGFAWPGEDLAIIALAVGFWLAALLGVALSRPLAKPAEAPVLNTGDQP
jgi:uncharacterized membrane protein